MKRQELGLNIIKYVALFIILLFLLFPLYWVLMTSFKTNMEAYRSVPTFIPAEPTVQSYINLFTKNNDFFVYYKNNFIVSGATALITTVLAILSGYALSRFHFRWNAWVTAALLSSQMFPVVSRMISLYDLMNKMHLINTHPGLIFALTAAMLPFTVMLMSSFFDGVPREVEEAAYVDGASRLQVLWRIVTPLVKPGMLAVAIYAFLMTWDDYLHAVTLIQNDALRTMSAGVAMRYLGELSYDWSLINTISIVGTVPMLILFFFFQKYMVKGLVAGAVKG
ncbi:MAG TPA: carbohydrate ABC transporter permease [Candidatus Gemmiger avistercoris]|uniref:Carbohydrate ABC transporter permease n=1 Tax=Candidatus Gemmiger avistercoris TaxID=2838606 RepID=A0A9D2FID9_9FIRM|nr:carbohydrate ABC transporter permease [uncultured Subdoligranulum sp.]HIZ61634.1 carbohydrate ABC transporter permease [Candidatus Gemmiger avistercoris]